MGDFTNAVMAVAEAARHAILRCYWCFRWYLKFLDGIQLLCFILKTDAGKECCTQLPATRADISCHYRRSPVPPSFRRKLTRWRKEEMCVWYCGKICRFQSLPPKLMLLLSPPHRRILENLPAKSLLAFRRHDIMTLSLSPLKNIILFMRMPLYDILRPGYMPLRWLSPPH